MVNPENFFIENFDSFYVFKVFYLGVSAKHAGHE